MSVAVRDVTLQDAQGIIDILNPIIEDGRYTILDSTFTLEEEQFFIQVFSENGVFNVAQHAETSYILGFQTVEPFANYTRSFDHVGIIGTYVEANSRRQGIASALFASTFEKAKTMGYEKLFAYVRDDNEAALATYLKNGFEVVGRAKKHAKINGKYIDEILIEKFL
ncbi:GNAT family N-acetyltransferase [Enterovibrio sp. ZSDZ35]|uniref:GNAT family N-acetyltransferase n=1 Tax=Enterovibrio qingdaonensis TaxID=2899818 RepID=A0ABT5QKZ1_9GAMM|nr:GNAT family N-acetyltransferase [Enterovibrio sp. ZSDZ35]MDD1780976.1 GNAT family N-acetyltransferase [Enterovibrio sp. ZSDZ35]